MLKWRHLTAFGAIPATLIYRKTNAMNNWSINQAKSVYNIAHWSGGYFDIDHNGHLVALPAHDANSQGVDLYRFIDELKF